MENQNSGGWLFVGLCCIAPLVWGGLWWAIGRYLRMDVKAARGILRRRDL